MKTKIRNLIRSMTRRFWSHEIQVTEGVAKLEELNMDHRTMEIRIKTVPGLKEHMALCMAEILGNAPNYAEVKFDLVAPKDGEEWQWVTVTVVRDKGKTPHQLLAEAEAKIVDLNNQIVDLTLKLRRAEARRKEAMKMIT